MLQKTTRQSTPFRRQAVLFILIALLAFVTVASASAAEKWIHIKVDDGKDEQVTVNLPLSLVSSAAALIPSDVHEEIHGEMEVALDDLQLEWQELRDFWEEVKKAPEATFVTVQTRDEKVEVKKEGEYMLVKTTESTERGAQVDVKFPMRVVDALLSGPEGTLDFQAALNALAEEGPGHIVSVKDGDETVKIWIDDQNETD